MDTLTESLRRGRANLVTGALLAVLGLGAYALWLGAQDRGDFERRRGETIAALSGRRQELRTALEGVQARRGAAAAETKVQHTRIVQAAKIIAQLQELASTWDRLVGNPAQQRANAEQIAHMEEVREVARTRADALQQELPRLKWEADGLEIALGKVEPELAFAQAHSSEAGHFLLEAWRRAKWWIAAGLALVWAGPAVARWLRARTRIGRL